MQGAVSFSQVELEPLIVSDQFFLRIPNRRDIESVVLHAYRKKYFLAASLEALYRLEDLFFALFRVTVEERLAKEIRIAALCLVVVNRHGIEVSNDVIKVNIDKRVG